MGDRRVGDRREKEKGVIKINVKETIGYVILGCMFVISLIMNIILVMQNTDYKNELEDCYDYISELEEDYYYDYYDDDYYYEEDEDVEDEDYYEDENHYEDEDDNELEN